jgi:hypothetical protein
MTDTVYMENKRESYFEHDSSLLPDRKQTNRVVFSTVMIQGLIVIFVIVIIAGAAYMTMD